MRLERDQGRAGGDVTERRQQRAAHEIGGGAETKMLCGCELCRASRGQRQAGDRDRAKRPLMGGAVDEFADWGIITSDNPRSESPEAIIADVERGFRKRNYEIVVDRKAAIFQAISMAQPRDIILIAGKGHEASQEFADHIVPFDDVSMAREALEAKPVEMKDR